jgi:uncharacterized membrane protein (UPF0182 family)
MTTKRWLILALGAAAIVLIVGRLLAGAYSDYLWYDAVGAIALWRARLGAMVVLRVGSAIGAGLLAFANLYAVRQSVVSLVFPRRLGNLEIGEEVPGRYLLGAAIVLSVLFGVALAMPQSDWATFILARNGRSFGEADGYFGRDLGFFVYWLPFENALWTWAFFCVMVISVTVILLYALTPSLKWQRGGLYASTYVRRHFTVLVGMLLIMLAWGFRLDMYSLVMDGSGIDGAFSYVDHHIGLPGDLLLSIATFGAALIVLWAGFVGQIRLAGIAVFTVVSLSLIVRELAPAIAGHTGSEAERAANERSYLSTRAKYTRRAFGTDAIRRADSTVAYPSLAAALPWVSAWDPPALARAIDGGRVGDDESARIAWHWSPGGLTGDVVEPPPAGASPRAPWTVARVLASDADERGAPLRVAGPHASATDDSPLDAPLVYPAAGSFTIIADSLNHSAGSPLDPWLARVANAWALQHFRILSNDLPQPRPTLIAHRDIRDRVSLFTPFFAQGRRVEPLLVGDSLYWGLDLYSVSSTYPLSRHTVLGGEDESYVRHAAVAIVQASTGDITVVPDSILDPIALSWVRRLPALFGNWSALPAGIRGLLPPPIDGLYAQATAFGRYGSALEDDPPRHIPTLDGADTSLNAIVLPIVLPGAQTTAITLPLVDDTDRLRGLLIGTGGTTRSTMWYPLGAPGPRWSAVIDRLRSVDSAGNAAREGPLAHGGIRTVPVRSGIAFIQPAYRWRPGTTPVLSRVALLVGDTTRSVTPGIIAIRPSDAPSGARDFKGSVSELYAAMREALRRGDWTAFGRAFDALGRAIGAPDRR